MPAFYQFEKPDDVPIVSAMDSRTGCCAGDTTSFGLPRAAIEARAITPKLFDGNLRIATCANPKVEVAHVRQKNT
jgi:hypothetical protein